LVALAAQQFGIVSAVGDRPRPEVHRLNAALIRLSPAVSARKIALVIEQARGVPAIAEFGVY
jgi:hypothetical protein